MKAPNKIYVDNPNHNCWYYTKEENSVEYIRTDVFVERAVNFLKMLGCGFTITDPITHTNYDKEQLVEDFKNCMKG